MKYIFVYGSLMFDDILERLNITPTEKTHAQLRDYQCLKIKKEPFPGIKYAPGNKVEGFILAITDKNQMKTLDNYEGDIYLRQEVTVHVKNQHIKAEAYVIQDHDTDLLTNEEWSSKEFKEKHLFDFIEKYL